MALTAERSLDEVRAGLQRWLGRPVEQLTRPSAGFSCDTVVVDEELVVRLPPAGEGIFPTYDLAQQAAVQEACGRASVPVAVPCRVEVDPTYLGCTFAAMPFVRGAIPSDFTPTDPWLTSLATDADRRTVWDGFLDVLLAIHRTPTDGLRLRDGVAAELDAWERYLRWATDGAAVPALAEVLRWCRANAPTSPPPSGLLWGDVRLGNVVFDEATLQPAAVLDWDMASAGPFELDLAWFLALEDVQRELTGMVVPGFGTRDEAIARAERGLGRQLHELPWYEVFALARASAVSTRIATLQQRSGGRSMFRIGEDPALAAAQKAMARA